MLVLAVLVTKRTRLRMAAQSKLAANVLTLAALVASAALARANCSVAKAVIADQRGAGYCYSSGVYVA